MNFWWAEDQIPVCIPVVIFAEKPVSSIKSCLPCLEFHFNHRKSAVFFNHCIGYHAPLDLYVEFNHMSSNLEHPFPGDRYINLCVGKEWYRYPSSFFLPSDRWEKMTPKHSNISLSWSILWLILNDRQLVSSLYLLILERFSNGCRKPKTKAITPTNHNRSRQRDEPINS